MENKCFYITGSSGFIGSNLIKKMKEKDFCYYRITRTKNNTNNSITTEDYSDLSEPRKNSTLIHLAELNDVTKAEKIGESFIQTNIKKIISLVKKKWINIIYVSSALIYDFDNINLTSNDCLGIIKADNIYKRSKLECEKIILENGGTVLRMTNIYGPGMSQNNVISDILMQLSSNEIKLKNLYANRDFLWVDDAVDAIISSSKKKYNDIFNVASNKSINIYNLAKQITKLYGDSRKQILGIENSRKNNEIVININKTKKILNWIPKTNLETGIKCLLTNYDK
jgi:UDP-glucose 4-epimerase